jgi:probable rRNA maturation factor
VKIFRLENKQKAKTIDCAYLKKIWQFGFADLLGLRSYRICVRLVSPEKMAQLNAHFLQHHGSTDVITFDYREGYEHEACEKPAELEGEIFISVSDAVAQAREFKTTWQQELVRYGVHGILHLLGFDDLESSRRRVMKRKENAITEKLAREFNLKKVGL